MNIQELLGGGGETASKFASFSSSPSPTCPSTPSPSPSPTTASTLSKVDGNNSDKNKGNNSSQNLRCPRCDSTNTKFCYYNNYNLTQPRHFCKTCRRYWTKGGTLRNVPIGGGCRKNKSTSANSASSALAKAKATLSTEILVNGLNPAFLRNGFLDPLQPDPNPNPSPSLWASSSLPQGQTTSHILSLLRSGANHCPKPNPNDPNPIPPGFTALETQGDLNLESGMYGNGAPSLLGLEVVGPGNNSNILELYQKWKSSGNYNNYYYCCNENGNGVVTILGNMMGSATALSSSSNPLKSNGSDASPLGEAGESNIRGYGITNSSFSSCWSEFPTVPINGTFP